MKGNFSGTIEWTSKGFRIDGMMLDGVRFRLVDGKWVHVSGQSDDPRVKRIIETGIAELS